MVHDTHTRRRLTFSNAVYTNKWKVDYNQMFIGKWKSEYQPVLPTHEYFLIENKHYFYGHPLQQ